MHIIIDCTTAQNQHRYADSLDGFEFKWNKERKAPKSWLEYTNATYKLVNMDNFKEFLKIN
ncbi:MAG: hypothetical protein PHP96_02605 [Candidatus Dojkabacteria bacterium]|jgi:hypothetical protein|nr:hypothetical protein [Candidatus Dojkabacteria bacterium]MDD4561039.1 hypothetical protein [Candidatus Dojkabacteria bacterium]